jgi:hypothetical protein
MLCSVEWQDDEWEVIWKEMVVAYLAYYHGVLPGRTKEIYMKPEAVYPVSCLRCELSTVRIRLYSLIAKPTHSLVHFSINV